MSIFHEMISLHFPTKSLGNLQDTSLMRGGLGEL